MAGPQVSLGYRDDPQRTAASFVVSVGRGDRFYRAGDRVRRSAIGKPLAYLGRVVDQLKVLGHRIEFGEIEAAVGADSGVDGVDAVGWPISLSGAGRIEVFVQAEEIDLPLLQNRVAKPLPSYMVPRRIHLVSAFPLNSNIKFDRAPLILAQTE